MRLIDGYTGFDLISIIQFCAKLVISTLQNSNASADEYPFVSVVNIMRNFQNFTLTGSVLPSENPVMLAYTYRADLATLGLNTLHFFTSTVLFI